MTNGPDLLDKRHVFTDCDDKFICKVRRSEHNYRQVYEFDKKLKREIANSNERRRMQSINTGFENLKKLLPMSIDGEKLSKASILQLTAKYIQTLLSHLSTLEKEIASYDKATSIINDPHEYEQTRKRRLTAFSTVELSPIILDNLSSFQNSEPSPLLEHKVAPSLLSANQNPQVSLSTNHKSPSPILTNHKSSSSLTTNRKYPSSSPTNHKPPSSLSSNHKAPSPLLPKHDATPSPMSNHTLTSPPSSNHKHVSPVTHVHKPEVPLAIDCIGEKTPGSLEHLVAAIEQVEGERFYVAGTTRGHPEGDCVVMKPTISPFTEKIILAVTRHPHMFPRVSVDPIATPATVPPMHPTDANGNRFNF